MKAAVYPQKHCREPLFSANGTGCTCELPLMHTGPHASFSARDSVQRRDAWDAEHPEQAGKTSTLDGDIVVEKTGEVIS